MLNIRCSAARIAQILLCCGLLSQVCAADPVSVHASHSRTESHSITREFTGSFTAKLHSQLSAEQAGLVSQVLVDAGQQVTKGQLLAKLDDQLATEAVKEQQAAVQLAEAELTEQKRLVAEANKVVQGASLPATELHRREAELQKARAELRRQQALLAQAQLQLNKHQIRAPYAGVISRRQAMPGNWLEPGQAVFELVALDQLWLDVDIPQQYYPEIARLEQATVMADMAPEQPLLLPVAARVPVGRHDSRAFQVRLALSNSQQPWILPGTSAHVRFEVSSEPLTGLPQAALLRHPDGAYSVFTLPAQSLAGQVQTPVRQVVELVERKGSQVTVRGLNTAALVLTSGHLQLSEQQQVKLESIALSGE